MYIFSEISLLPTLLLIILWLASGWLIAFRLFDLHPRERGLVGLGLGMVMSTWLSNFTARFLPLLVAFWVSALIVFAFGIYLNWSDVIATRTLRVFFLTKQSPTREEIVSGGQSAPERPRNDIYWGQWFAFILLAILFTLINRGLAIFEDYQNLPVMSMMGTGQIPPPFPLAQGVTFNYHYFLLLLATQFVSIGHAAVWTALDLARGLSMSLVFMLFGLFSRRIVDKPLAQYAGSFFAMFAGGARWLLLLMPLSLVQRISDSVTLIGSAAQSGGNLFDLLYKSWLIDGAPPVPFPFMFVSGVNNPAIMHIGGQGITPALTLLLAILVGTRVRGKMSTIPLTILLASMALANEVTFALLAAGIALAMIVWAIQNRSLRLPESLWLWFAIFLASGVLSLVQGGIITGVAAGLFGDSSSGYFEGGLHFVFPPTVVSGHLSILSLFNPYQLIAALLELGPAIVVFPLAVIYGCNAFKDSNWLEAGFVFSGIVSLLMVFVQYSGNAGLTATSRLYGNFIFVTWIYAVPLVWKWASPKGEAIQNIALSFGLLASVSGLVLFASQISAFYRPISSYILSDLDVKMYEKYWNKLPEGVMVFDSSTPRGATVFGRGSDSAETLYRERPDFIALVDAPDPVRVHDAGYDYMYYTNFYWDDHKDYLDASCVKVIDQMDDIHSATGEMGNFRRLVDISACK
jgi:hypothetical protein